MPDITIVRETINHMSLDAELRSALGSAISGISTGPYGVMVHLDDTVTPEQITQVQAIVIAHDPETLTPEQQAQTNLFNTIKMTAQSAVGVPVNDLTAAQVKALLAVQLYNAGAVATDGTIQPLDEWVQERH